MHQKLKVLLGLILSVIFIGACKSGSSGACKDSTLIGTWDEDGGADVMKFKSSCSGTSSSCGSTFTFPNVTDDSGTATVDVTITDGGGSCLPLGETDCAYGIVGDSLAFDCGGGEVTYTRQ